MKIYILVQEIIDHHNESYKQKKISPPDIADIAKIAKQVLVILLGAKVEVEKNWDAVIDGLVQEKNNKLPLYARLPMWLRDNLVDVGENSDSLNFDKHPENEKNCICFEIDDDLMNYLSATERKAAKDDLYKLTTAVIRASYLTYQARIKK